MKKGEAKKPSAEKRRLSLRIENVPVGKLVEFKGNPRSTTADALERIGVSIGRFGFVNPVLAWKNAKGEVEIIAGHQRVRAAKAVGVGSVPVIILPFTEAEARAYNVADNRLAELSAWDFPALKDVLESIDTGAFEMDLTGFSFEEREALETWTRPDFDKSRADLEEAADKFTNEHGAGGLVYRALFFKFEDEDDYVRARAVFGDGAGRQCDAALLMEAMRLLEANDLLDELNAVRERAKKADA